MHDSFNFSCCEGAAKIECCCFLLVKEIEGQGEHGMVSGGILLSVSLIQMGR